MFRNYFIIAIYHLKKNSFFSIINITGLSLGLACCILISLFIKDEISYDRFHDKKDFIYQLTCDKIEKEGPGEKVAIAAMVQGPAFKKEIPEIQEFVRVNSKIVVVKQNNQLFSEKVTWVDDNFFSVFSFPLIYGNPKRVLSDLKNIVLTDETAKKYFGTSDALGKMLQLQINGKFESFIVSGIAKKAPENSSIKFNLLLPFKYLENSNPDNGWMWVSYPTFFVIDKNADVKRIPQKMKKVYQVQAKSEIDLNELAGYSNRFVWGLKPFVQMHLNTTYTGTPESSNPIYSYILICVALFILIIACINFVNLTIAQSLKRTKEIGIRKVIGSLRIQFIYQFLGESLLICLFAFILGMILAQLALPMFNELSNKKLSLSYLFDFKLAIGFILLFLFTAFISGFYPALVLSAYNPVQILNNKIAKNGKNKMTKGLVIIQFTIAIFMIIAMMFIYSQFTYLTKADLGYNDKNLLEFTVDKAIMNKSLMDVFKVNFFKIPGVENVAYRNVGIFGGKTQAGNHYFNATYLHIDENFLPVIQAKMIKGRNFSKDFPSDSTSSVIVNETFAKVAALKNPVGQTIDYMNFPGWGSRKIMIIGVVKDFHDEPLKEKIKPQVFIMDQQLPLGRFIIRLEPTNMAGTISKIEKIFHQVAPDQPFQYAFQDDLNRKSYESEAKWKQIITWGALLTIIIACIGLYGLAMLSSEKRYKEMSIRKVLGASTFQMVKLISFDFIKLVLIAYLIAIPIAWISISKWLQNFAYRVDLSWWIFAIAGVASIMIALATVSFHAIKATVRNPITSLRSE